MKKLINASSIVVKHVPRSRETAEPFNVHRMPSVSASARTRVSSDEQSVVDAANVATRLWGESAATAVAWCGLSAYCEGAIKEYRFWFEVFVHLQTGSSDTTLEGMLATACKRSFN